MRLLDDDSPLMRKIGVLPVAAWVFVAIAVALTIWLIAALLVTLADAGSS